MASYLSRIHRWFRQTAPRREDIEKNRWLRPFARRPELWRFTRRSVPRGVAVGLFVGILLMIPGVQIIGSAIVAAPFRANFPIAAVMTFLSNPLTTPFILGASIWVGNLIGFHADLATFLALHQKGASFAEWLAWLASDAAPAMLSGLAIIAAVCAAVGYVLADLGWQLWTARKWRRRRTTPQID